jgi:prepilin-type N-terminal cleavage/methylation domain-containing protein
MTLIEVLAALAILAVGTNGVMTMMTISLHLDAIAKERSIATALVSDRIQRLSSMPLQVAADYANYGLPEETAAEGPPQTFTTDYGDLAGYPKFKRVVELTYDVPTSGMLSVKTTVSWQHINRKETSHEMIVFLHPFLE